MLDHLAQPSSAKFVFSNEVRLALVFSLHFPTQVRAFHFSSTVFKGGLLLALVYSLLILLFFFYYNDERVDCT